MAIINSSLVGITTTVTLELRAEIIFPSGNSSTLALASILIHRYHNFSHSIFLIIALCSITPAVRTITSTQPSNATYAQIYFTRECIYISRASMHFLFHFLMPVRISLISLDTQETPSNQLFLLSISSIS